LTALGGLLSKARNILSWHPYHSGLRRPDEVSHSCICEAVSSCLIFLNSSSFWGPSGRAAARASSRAFRATI
jgi:hypothetical protein